MQAPVCLCGTDAIEIWELVANRELEPGWNVVIGRNNVSPARYVMGPNRSLFR
jgi:hypothetical protein